MTSNSNKMYNKRKTDKHLKEIKDHLVAILDLKFENLSIELNNIKKDLNKHEILLYGNKGKGGIIRELEFLKNFTNLTKWIYSILGITSLGILINKIKHFFQN